MGETSIMSSAPADRYNLIYVIFYWLGMGSLLPWNFFISVNGYWKYKFRNVSHDHLEAYDAGAANATAAGLAAPEKLSHLQIEWNSYLSIASMIPNVTFLLLNAAFGHRQEMATFLFLK